MSLNRTAALALALLSVTGCEEEPPPGEPEAAVEPGAAIEPGVEVELQRVVDGDTIRVRYQGRMERVRYIGIDTPELAHEPGEVAEPFAVEATEANRRLLGGERVRLVFDVEERDRYGRLLAYVYAGDEMVNEALLREGFAQTLTVPPNVRHAERFAALQREARAARRGLWGR